MNPSQMIAAMAANDTSRSAIALMRLSEVLKLQDERVTIAAEKTVQDIEREDIFIGSAGIRLRGLLIPYEGLSIVTKLPAGGFPSMEDIMAGEACIFHYGRQEKSFLTVVGRESGMQLKMQYVTEAIDVAAMVSMNTGTRMLLSEDGDDECEVVDPTDFRVDEEGILFGSDRMVPWSEVSAVTTQGTLSVAIGRQRMMTLNEC